MKLREIFEAKASVIAGQLDSNGREVKLDKINMGLNRTSSLTAEEGKIYHKVKNTADKKARYRVTKIGKSKVCMDMVDNENKPIEGHSGNRDYQVTHSTFAKEYEVSAQQ